MVPLQAVVCLLLGLASALSHGGSVLHIPRSDNWASTLAMNDRLWVSFASGANTASALDRIAQLVHPDIVVARVDCALEPTVCVDHGISSFPSFKYFKYARSGC